MSKDKKLVIMINPQWTGGQIVSDFGIFGRKKKEDFVNSFTTTYSLQTKRMCGEDIRYALWAAVRCGFATHATTCNAQTRCNSSQHVQSMTVVPARAGR